jgi:hypothetical protein
MRTISLTVAAAAVVLGGCAIELPSPPPSTHPASPAAQEAPVVDAGALLRPDRTVSAAEDEPAAAPMSGHHHHHAGMAGMGGEDAPTGNADGAAGEMKHGH